MVIRPLFLIDIMIVFIKLLLNWFYAISTLAVLYDAKNIRKQLYGLKNLTYYFKRKKFSKTVRI